MSTSSEKFVSPLLKAWTSHVNKVSELTDTLPESDWKKEIAPGRNTGHYLLGHLVAVHDAMLPLLGFGEKMFPELEKPFIKSPDRSGFEFPPIEDLKKKWRLVNDELLKHYNKLTPEEWLTRHASVSEADFAKEPHRHKLSVLISRTTHMSSHVGQLILLSPKREE